MSDPFGLDDLSPEWLASKPGIKWSKHPGAIAAWVADMDFRPAPAVIDALRAVLDTGDLGYPHWPTYHGSDLTGLFVDRMERLYGWSIDPLHVVESNDVVHALQLVLHACSQPGDGVVLHTPAYPPFLTTLTEMDRRLVEVPAERAANGWADDLDALEARLGGHEQARVLLLCHPQNPTGRVFQRDELVRLAEIAEVHDLVIISDEIHADLVHAPHRHVPMASVSAEAAARTVTLTSASKAFNLAGLRWAVAHVGPEWLRARFAELPNHWFGAANIMAVAATRAAWTSGGEWLDAVRTRLDENRMLLSDLLSRHLPEVRYSPPEATYLAWLDFTAMRLPDEPATLTLHAPEEHRVALSPGLDFGPRGAGFARLNLATSPAVLHTVVQRIAAALEVARR